MDDIDFIDESTFKRKLSKLYKLVVKEAIRLKVPIDTYEFVYCEGIGDVIDVQYTNNYFDFDMSVKGAEKRGYRILYSGKTEI